MMHAMARREYTGCTHVTRASRQLYSASIVPAASPSKPSMSAMCVSSKACTASMTICSRTFRFRWKARMAAATAARPQPGRGDAASCGAPAKISAVDKLWRTLAVLPGSRGPAASSAAPKKCSCETSKPCCACRKSRARTRCLRPVIGGAGGVAAAGAGVAIGSMLLLPPLRPAGLCALAACPNGSKDPREGRRGRRGSCASSPCARGTSCGGLSALRSQSGCSKTEV